MADSNKTIYTRIADYVKGENSSVYQKIAHEKEQLVVRDKTLAAEIGELETQIDNAKSLRQTLEKQFGVLEAKFPIDSDTIAELIAELNIKEALETITKGLERKADILKAKDDEIASLEENLDAKKTEQTNVGELLAEIENKLPSLKGVLKDLKDKVESRRNHGGDSLSISSVKEIFGRISSETDTPFTPEELDGFAQAVLFPTELEAYLKEEPKEEKQEVRVVEEPQVAPEPIAEAIPVPQQVEEVVPTQTEENVRQLQELNFSAEQISHLTNYLEDPQLASKVNILLTSGKKTPTDLCLDNNAAVLALPLQTLEQNIATCQALGVTSIPAILHADIVKANIEIINEIHPLDEKERINQAAFISEIATESLKETVEIIKSYSMNPRNTNGKLVVGLLTVPAANLERALEYANETNPELLQNPEQIMILTNTQLPTNNEALASIIKEEQQELLSGMTTSAAVAENAQAEEVVLRSQAAIQELIGNGLIAMENGSYILRGAENHRISHYKFQKNLIYLANTYVKSSVTATSNELVTLALLYNAHLSDEELNRVMASFGVSTTTQRKGL